MAVPGNTYSTASGSSLSAPQAAGLAAYLLGDPVHSTSLDAGSISFGMKKLLRELGRHIGPIVPIGFLINNGIRDEFCGSGTKVKGREIAYLDDRYYGRQTLRSPGNESSPGLDHSTKTVFTEEADKEGSFSSILFPTSLSSNQSSMDDFFTLPTQNLAIARDLQGRFIPPNPSFFTTTADSTSESAAPEPTTTADSIFESVTLKQTVTQLDSPSPSPSADSTPESATPKPTTTSNRAFLPFSGLASEVHSAPHSPTSVGANGVQITDFSGLDVSITLSKKLPWHQDPQCFLSMLTTLRDPSSSLAYLDRSKDCCETVCLVLIKGSKSLSRLMDVGRRVGLAIALNLIEPSRSLNRCLLIPVMAAVIYSSDSQPIHPKKGITLISSVVAAR